MKTALLKNTTPLFLQHGYRSLSMKDIAKHNAVSQSTLYQLFKTKNNLIRQTLALRKQLFYQLHHSAQHQTTNAIAHFYLLKHSIEQKVSIVQQRNNLLELKQYYPKLFLVAKQDLEQYIEECFTEIYDRGVKEQLFTKGKENIAFLYANQFFAYRLNAEIPEQKLAKLANQSEDMFILALLTDTGRIEFAKQQK